MADSPLHPNGHTGEEGTPLWVKVFELVFLALVVLFVVVHLTIGGLASHSW